MTLLRRHIGQRLAEYYAQPSSAVVGSAEAVLLPEAALNFNGLWGEWHWKRVFQRAYREQKGQWLTPLELFRPYYSHILGNFIANNASSTCQQHHAADDAGLVEVVELGGGRGTNAQLILDYLQRERPDVYQRMSYTIIDSSPTLHNLQRDVLLGEGAHHNRIIDLELKDLMSVAEQRVPLLKSQPTKPGTTIVIALEVLDNLPHDKIRVRGGGHLVEQAELLHGEKEEEVFAPLSDPLLKTVLQTAPIYMKTDPILWVPTVACGVLQQLVKERSQAQLLIADFDWLPPPDHPAVGGEDGDSNMRQRRSSTWAKGEPLITSMEDLDYECYLHAPRKCDILFPTNFAALSSFVRKVWNKERPKRAASPHVSVQKQAEFLSIHGSEQVASTRSWLTGYSPLLHDFSNCSILSVTNNNLEA